MGSRRHRSLVLASALTLLAVTGLVGCARTVELAVPAPRSPLGEVASVTPSPTSTTPTPTKAPTSASPSAKPKPVSVKVTPHKVVDAPEPLASPKPVVKPTATASATSTAIATATASATASTSTSATPSPTPSTPLGVDISYPQCGATLTVVPAFAIVGVNGGTAATTNPCLATQLRWARGAVGGTSQPRIQLYVNTGNPGQIIDRVTTWPKAGDSVTPYGTCDGTNTLACSWLYGFNRAVDDVLRLQNVAGTAGVSAAASDYVWWLDVETMNTWQSGSAEALARNAATLEGMTAYFQSLGARVGVYSTSYQWGLIAGSNRGVTANLTGLDSWLAGSTTQAGAIASCTKAPLTGGRVTLTQFVSGLDYNHSCVG